MSKATERAKERALKRLSENVIRDAEDVGAVLAMVACGADQMNEAQVRGIGRSLFASITEVAKEKAERRARKLATRLGFITGQCKTNIKMGCSISIQEQHEMIKLNETAMGRKTRS